MEKFKNVVSKLEANNISVILAENKESVKEIVENLLFEGAVISGGGSVSVNECGINDLLKDSKYNYLDRLRQGITPKEQNEIFRQIIGCDFYFCSANAITENGELINVDGFCNRISAIAFGPKRVIMIVGKNKIVKDVQAGILRVKQIAAPKNCERLNLDNPCRKLGHCISLEKSDNPDFTDGCRCATRICRNYLVSSLQMQKGRITVILVDEDLGY